MLNSELKDPTLVHASAREAIKALTKELNNHDVPMSKFTEILIWEKRSAEQLANIEIERDKLHGWKIENRKWCGVDLADFEIPSLGIYAQRKHK